MSAHSSATSGAPAPAAARSMTGFARARRSTPDGEIVVSVKSVNHRSLDLHFQMGPDLDAIEQELRGIVRRRLARGHVEVRVGITRAAAAPSGVALNTPLLTAYVHAFRQAADALGLSSEPDLNAALRMPGVLGEALDSDLPASLSAAVLLTLEDALSGLDEFRCREGLAIVAEMLGHNDRVKEIAAELRQIRVGALPAYQARLQERLGELLKGIAIDPQRLAQEAAVLADRSDVAEEIARLEIHADQLRALLTGGGEVGKKLDFLLQEMNRETNTILSKTTGLGEAGLRVTDLALTAKSEIEKIREQSLNLE